MSSIDPMDAAIKLASAVLDIYVDGVKYNEESRLEMVRFADIILGIDRPEVTE